MGELQNRKTKSSGRLYQGQKKLEVHLTYAHFDPSLNTSFQILAKYKGLPACCESQAATGVFRS